MARHWKALQWSMMALVASFILAMIKGWYIFGYGLVAATIVYGFVYLINVARLDGRPSYEDEDKARRRAANKGPGGA